MENKRKKTVKNDTMLLKLINWKKFSSLPPPGNKLLNRNWKISDLRVNLYKETDFIL